VNPNSDKPAAATGPSVGFQGEIGAFSELAAQRFHPEGCAVHPFATFEQLFSALDSGDIDEAVVPIENSLFGSVHTNYDLLREHAVRIDADLKLRIRHHLLAVPGSTLEQISSVISHPQAIGQCREFLATELPHAQVTPAYDTAEAAKTIAQGEVLGQAAIASRAAADEYGLEVLAEGIESNHENYTRFLLLTRGEARVDPSSTEPHVTSIVYAMRNNVPGALFKSLAVFALRELDLLKIESRPLVGSRFEYLFYLDFSGRLDDDAVLRALDHLKEIAAFVKVLGSYPVGPIVD
jgi:prephenate dehydratase